MQTIQPHPIGPLPKKFGQCIAILDRSFVYVGEVTGDNEFIHIAGAKNIHKWGTTKGLGELRQGPTKNTELHDVGSLLVPKRALISLMPCTGFPPST